MMMGANSLMACTRMPHSENHTVRLVSP
jgi:hypothetical protein